MGTFSIWFPTPVMHYKEAMTHDQELKANSSAAPQLGDGWAGVRAAVASSTDYLETAQGPSESQVGRVVNSSKRAKCSFSLHNNFFLLSSNTLPYE